MSSNLNCLRVEWPEIDAKPFRAVVSVPDKVPVFARIYVAASSAQSNARFDDRSRIATWVLYTPSFTSSSTSVECAVLLSSIAILHDEHRPVRVAPGTGRLVV